MSDQNQKNAVLFVFSFEYICFVLNQLTKAEITLFPADDWESQLRYYRDKAQFFAYALETEQLLFLKYLAQIWQIPIKIITDFQQMEQTYTSLEQTTEERTKIFIIKTTKLPPHNGGPEYSESQVDNIPTRIFELSICEMVDSK